MNLRHLGDPKDGMKQQVLGRLYGGRPQGDCLVVLPMLTDADRWTDSDRNGYCGYVEPGRVLSWRGITHNRNTRAAYFAPALEPDCLPLDLFLDPDNGIGDNSGRRLRMQISRAEISELLPAGSNRLLIVFQDSPNRARGGPLRDCMDHHLRQLHESGAPLTVGAWFTGDSNFVFVSRADSRPTSIRMGQIPGLLGDLGGEWIIGRP